MKTANSLRFWNNWDLLFFDSDIFSKAFKWLHNTDSTAISEHGIHSTLYYFVTSLPSVISMAHFASIDAHVSMLSNNNTSLKLFKALLEENV